MSAATSADCFSQLRGSPGNLIAGFAYFIYTSGVAQGFTFTMPALDSFRFDKNLAQGYAIAVVGLAIGVQLFKAAVKTDHAQMA